MTERRNRAGSTSRQAILVALLISLLLHQLFLTGVGSLFDFTEPVKETRHEVVLREEPTPEEKPVPEEKPAPKKQEEKKTESKVAKRPPKPKIQKKRPTPSKEPPQPEKPSSTQEMTAGPLAPPPDSAIATGPNPTPDILPTPPDLDFKWKSFEKIFGAKAKQERESYAQAALEKRRGRGAFGNYSNRVMRAIRNNKSFIEPGRQEVLGSARQKLFHNYIEAIHEASIHPLFADSFLESLPSLSANDPLNDWSLHMVAEFEIFESGQISEVRVVKSSGNMVFDAGAVDAIYRSSPFPRPPKSVLSWNRRVYLRWGFYRNHRKCGVFNVEPYILRAPGAQKEALPVDKFTIDDG